MDISIEWSATPVDGGKQLRIEYTATNRSTERLWLCDLLLTHENNKLILVPDRFIVMNGQKPHQVLFARGRVSEHVPSAFPRNPAARAFDPGKTLTGSGVVPLPLTAWHNYGFAQPIEGRPKTAILELSYVKGDASWGELKLDDGTKVTVPLPPTHLLTAAGEEHPIPRS